jgi:hypothetical protein
VERAKGQVKKTKPNSCFTRTSWPFEYHWKQQTRTEKAQCSWWTYTWCIPSIISITNPSFLGKSAPFTAQWKAVQGAPVCVINTPMCFSYMSYVVYIFSLSSHIMCCK